MREIGLEESKQIQVKILDVFAEYCDKNNLRYFLGYGTLIGCIRHNGFIPWDDDIDILMPRRDYNFLLKNFNKNNNLRNYQLISPFEDCARHSIAKLIDIRTVKVEKNVDYANQQLGIDIDIFPLDGQPEEYENFVKWRQKLFKLYRLFNLYIEDLSQMSLKRHIIAVLLRNFIKKDYLLLKAQQLHEKYPYEESKYVGVMECLYYDEGDRARKECFEEFILGEFEKKWYRIPKGYDEVLKNLYGDYLKLPPKEQRVTHHTNSIYWKNEFDNIN